MSSAPLTSSSVPASTTASAVFVAIEAASSVEPLTTTFSPPASCTQNHLTMLSSPDYQIWVNEPVPVPSTTLSACYPSQFIAGYTSTLSSSIAPFLNPLVCPDGWVTAMTGESSYVACCPTDFELAMPTVTVSPSRPAYGGTCYSNFALGQTVNVTAYNSVSLIATSTWLASVSTDQAYGHVIDGIAAYLPTPASNTTAAAIPTTSTISTTPTPTPSSSSSSSLSGGAIAGIVIGVLASLTLLLTTVILALRHRRRAQRARAHEIDAASTTIAEKDGSDGSAGGGKAAELYSPADTTELPSPAALHELDGGQDGYAVEMGEGGLGAKEGARAVEMDAGGKAGEGVRVVERRDEKEGGREGFVR